MIDRRAALGVFTLALAAACGGPEHKVVDQYFTALNAKDSQTLSSFAAVSLDTQGKRVDNWKVTQSEPEQRGPAPLVELVKKAKEAEQAVADNKKAANSYALDNLTDVDQVRELAKKSQPIPARLKPVAEKWDAFNQKDRELKKALAEAKEELEHEKRIVALSLGTVEGLEELSGELVTKNVQLTTTIEGQQQAYVMTLRKYELAKGDAPKAMSRWVVFGLKQS